MNEQNVNDYQSGSPNYSENINTVPISQFSTPRPILSASAILRNGANNFYVNIGIETNAYLKRLDGRMDRLEQTIKNMSGSQNNNNYAIDNAFLSIFPLKDIDSLKDFDIRITNEPDFKFNVITFISRIGGTDVKNVIKRVLQRIISNELSSKCSWTGFRNNFRLQNILFINIMKDLSREKFNSSDIDFEFLLDNLNHSNELTAVCLTNSPIEPISSENITLKDKLRQLICDYHISHNCVNKLLEILKSEGLDLPKDVRILFQIPKNYSIINVHPGTYIHIGIEFMITPILLAHVEQLKNTTDIQLGVHIDGLPISSSKSNLWPILISIVNILILSKYVMPVGIYYTLMTEMKSIISNGLCLNGKIYNFVISQLICDAPAKAFMLNVKSFNAYHSCNYCIEEGTFINDRMSFLGVSSPLRTDDSFRSKEDEDYHKGSSPLEGFPINIVLTVVLDYMHCVCLGVMKRLLTFWVKAKKPIRFKSPEIVSDISSQLIDIMKPYFPSEFNRLPRSLEELEFSKATEFRTFLLYTSLIVLKERLAKPFFQDFMLFHCAIKILISPGKSPCVTFNYLIEVCGYPKVELSEIPEECTSLFINRFFVDLNYHIFADPCQCEANKQMFDDLDEVLAFSKPVYLYYGHASEAEWTQLLACDGETNSLDEMIGLEAFFNEHPGITGVILSAFEHNEYSIELPGFSENLKKYIEVMKKTFPVLEIGIQFQGHFLIDQYTNPQMSWLDMALIEPVTDFFIIKVSDLNECTGESLYNSGIAPMTSSTTAYTMMCEHPLDTTLYCSESMESFYEKGQFAFENGAGFITDEIELNDPENQCNCEKPFGSFYALLNGFEGGIAKPCPFYRCGQ
ncbi:hypothetical protein QTP88_006432 [Uroleucon formosanum]